MRFHTTTEHSELLSKWQQDYAAHDVFAEAGDDGVSLGGTEESDLASEAEYASLDAFLRSPAITPTEIKQKIGTMRKRGPLHLDVLCWNEDEITSYFDRIEADLAQMQGWPASSPMLAAWTKWREIDERYEAAASRSDEEGEMLLEERETAYAALHRGPCVTPGDFIIKQYAHLHGTLGGTLYGQAKEDLTGNPHDIDIDGDHWEGRFEAIEQRACYEDIDATDVGANLLLYGQPFFDAEKWMERAHAIGLRVDLVQQQDGRWMFGQCMDLTGDVNRGNNPRIRREQDRLRRVIAKDYGGENRVSLLGDEIRRNWPQLVHPLPVEALS